MTLDEKKEVLIGLNRQIFRLGSLRDGEYTTIDKDNYYHLIKIKQQLEQMWDM